MKEEYLSSLKVKVDWQSLTTDEIDLVLEARIRMYQESVKENGHEAVREGYVLERIASIHNLRKADSLAQDGKVKINRYIRRHNLRKEEDLRALQMMILTLTFPEPEYTSDEIKSDAGKVRQIVKQKYFPWRILHYAIMLVIGPRRYRHLIYDTFACIKGKGLHFGVKRMKMFLRRYPKYRYVVKTDFKKFYQSIPHMSIEKAMRKRFKDENFIRLLHVALFTYDSGEDLIKILEDETARKKRSTHWGFHKSA